MSKLCISLPPFAPDYSGAASALYDMGGMIVIHDASGCTGNYTGYDEPRWLGTESPVFCSALRHMDAVLGNDEKVINRIVKAAEELNPKFIAILGSPVPMVIGTDFAGIANEIEYVTGIPTIGLPTRGLAYYGKGISDATIALMKKLVKQNKDSLPGTINLLGITPLDFYINSNAKDFRQLFEDSGIKVLASFNTGMQIEEMQESVAAQLNVVVSQAGIAIAKYMKQKYSIPYVVTTPLGDGSSALALVNEALQGTFPSEKNNDAGTDSKILIVGEQVIGNSIRDYMQKKYNVGRITMAGLYDMSSEYMQPQDMEVKNEKQLRALLNSKRFTTVIADPMIQTLLAKENAETMDFYPWPHVALSSKVHWEKYKTFLSEETDHLLQAIAKKAIEK